MEDINTIEKILRNKNNVIRESLNVYKCLKCEGTFPGRQIMKCPDKNCGGTMRFWRRISKDRIEDITSRRSARQCPVCMRIFYVWVEKCPYCSTMTLKGNISKKKNLMAQLFEYQMKK
jgi:hypothetical protein